MFTTSKRHARAFISPCQNYSTARSVLRVISYVDFKVADDFQRHVAGCNSDNMVPCELCHCLYNGHRLGDHTRACRNTSPSQQQQALIDYILPRTKYPVTPQQIPVFLQYRKQNRLSLDPHSIVEGLAEFGEFSSILFFHYHFNVFHNK